tara:strand:- start:2340 stop:3092 length:753 start_codon:yes stop_codon:yes gene_type:complete
MNKTSLDSCVIIPARYKSSRFPGKPLSKIKNKELILWVCELSAKAVSNKNVYVATDDYRIEKIVKQAGFNCIFTSENALTGTDRVAEAAKNLNYEIIINVQGDEPLVDPSDIVKCIEIKRKNFNMVINGFTWLKKDENVNSKNIPKVITNEKNMLVYISRQSLPGTKDFDEKLIKFKKQVCIYGFNKSELIEYKNYGRKGSLEYLEDIEILRFLEIEKRILMFECKKGSLAVDIPEDIERIETYLSQKND